MKLKFGFLAATFSMVILFMTSCKKDDVVHPPQATFSAQQIINTKIKDSVEIIATRTSSSAFDHVWKVGNDTISTTETFKHAFETAGSYTVEYIGKNRAGTITQNFTVNVEAIVREGGSSAFVTTLFEYVPAPGQFLNKAPGNLASANAILGNKNSMVTLGAWGGYIVLGFDHTVMNKPDTVDIQVYGNAFTNWSEPGIVYVMQDDNGNGKPDDTWYELKGSAFGTADHKFNYEVTYSRPASPDDDVPWRDNEGNTGFVKKNQFHRQAYYPEWITADSYTLKGSWLKSKVDRTNPTYVISPAYGWGYSDDMANSPRGGKVDIAHAINAQGESVDLKGIDFIKIQTAVLDDGGWLGEVSTEVNGVEDLNFGK